MRIIVTVIILLCLFASCSNNDVAPAAKQATAPAPPVNPPTPPDIEKKLDRILEDFANRICNDYWKKYDPHGQGPIDVTFDVSAYVDDLNKRWFNQIPHTWMDYKGIVEGAVVSILRSSAQRGNGDYMQLWTIVVEYVNDDGKFKKERTFEALPSNKYYREITGRDLPHQ